MNSELEKLIEKYRITVNGLADLESGYTEVIKERGFVTLNGLLAATADGTENAVNTEEHNEPAAPAPSDSSTEVHNEPAAPDTESDASHSEPTPVVPAPSGEPVAPAPVENPGVTPVAEGPVSGDTNLGTEVASGEGSNEPSPSGERSAESEEEGDSSEDSSDEPAAGGKPKKKKK